MPAVPLTRPAAEDAEGAPPEPLADGVYLRPCNPIPGATLTFDLVDVLFRGMPHAGRCGCSTPCSPAGPRRTRPARPTKSRR